jgi:hypothetical protein
MGARRRAIVEYLTTWTGPGDVAIMFNSPPTIVDAIGNLDECPAMILTPYAQVYCRPGRRGERDGRRGRTAAGTWGMFDTSGRYAASYRPRSPRFLHVHLWMTRHSALKNLRITLDTRDLLDCS